MKLRRIGGLPSPSFAVTPAIAPRAPRHHVQALKDDEKCWDEEHGRPTDGNMLPITTVSSASWPAPPAPVTTTSGTTPNMTANDVIKIDRSGSPAACAAASRIGSPSSRNRPADATLSIEFLLASAAINTMTI
jgi:hypothetical protein